MSHFKDYVCLVTGASRGIGRGIALGLADLGATVYITGRTMKPIGTGVGGSLEETAAEINARGGKAIPVAVDHSDEKQVTELFSQIRREQQGRLDVVVNNVYSAVSFLLSHAGKMYYEIDDTPPGKVWDTINNVGLRNHYICSTLATKMMIEYQKSTEMSGKPGLIVNVSSVGGKCYLFNTAYGVGKAALDRMTSDMAVELRKRKMNVCIISLWPGIVRTEEVTAIVQGGSMSNSFVNFVNDSSLSESPELSGLAVAALLKERPDQLASRSGDFVLVSDIAREHGLYDIGGDRPPDYRSLKVILRLAGFTVLARFIPGFVRLPKSIYLMMVGMSSS